jgi:hypothetical protein
MAPEDAPATKRDLAALEARVERVDSRIAALEERVDSRIASLEERLVEQLRDMQTEVLKAFLPYQERNRLEFRHLEANTNNTCSP